MAYQGVTRCKLSKSSPTHCLVFHVFIAIPQSFASQELLLRARKAKELQTDDLCSDGTSYLSGDFKARSCLVRLVSSRFCGLPAKSPDVNSAGH